MRHTIGAIIDFVRKYNPKVFHIPCVGSFSVAYCIAREFPDIEIHTSDISLFSSSLGYYLSNMDMSKLGIELDGDSFKIKNIDDLGSLMMRIKMCQLNPEKYYEKAIFDDMQARYDAYKDKIVHTLKQYERVLKGRITYAIDDLRTHIDDIPNKKSHLVYLDPPIYKSGYTKMFDFQGKLTWAEPDIEEFEPDEIKEIMNRIFERKPC